jgi:hypothetical protein
MQQVTYKLKMAKCSWNVVKSNNSCNVWAWKRTRFLFVFSNSIWRKESIIMQELFLIFIEKNFKKFNWTNTKLNDTMNSMKKLNEIRRVVDIIVFNLCSNLATPRLWTTYENKNIRDISSNVNFTQSILHHFHYKEMRPSSLHILLNFEYTWTNLLWWKWPAP